MSTLSAAVLATAETLNLCLPPPPDQRRVIERRFAAFIGKQDGPPHNLVQRLRLAPSEIEEAVAAVRELFRAAGRRAVTWEIGPSCEPSDLAARLLALGMVPDEEPEVAGMVLTTPPASAPSGVAVREARSLADFCAHARIYHRCFGHGGPARSDAELELDFERRRGREDHLKRYLALADGAPVAAADAVLVEGAVVLCGGATLPEARGRGAYRALCAARWDDACARGTPVLVVQAGRMSRPILGRLGFREVVRLRVLLDRFD